MEHTVAFLKTCIHERALWHSATLEASVKKCIKVLCKHKKKFTAIAVCGYCAAIFGGIVAARMKKNIVLVRKPKEDEYRHSDRFVEGISNQSCVFIDDLISSGETVKKVVEGLRELKCTLYGVYLYNYYDDTICIQYTLNNIGNQYGTKILALGRDYTPTYTEGEFLPNV